MTITVHPGPLLHYATVSSDSGALLYTTSLHEHGDDAFAEAAAWCREREQEAELLADRWRDVGGEG